MRSDLIWYWEWFPLWNVEPYLRPSRGFHSARQPHTCLEQLKREIISDFDRDIFQALDTIEAHTPVV